MRAEIRRRAACQAVAAGFAFAILITGSPPPAFAAIGDTLANVTVPAAAQCLGINLRTSIAVVPGSKLGFPQIPILLVTSCYVGFEPSAAETAQRNQLFVIDPSTMPATLKTTLTTTFAPPHGWGALAHRPDKGDLIGCASHNFPAAHKIYAIDYSDFTATPNGAATFLFNAQNDQFEICDGLAWDPSNETIYMGTDVNHTIYHYSATGTLLGTFPSPLLPESEIRCPKSGLSVVGGTLFVGCNGQSILFQLDKTTGAVIRSFTPPEGTRTEDLECDPFTFAASHKDALWTMNGVHGSNQLFAFEIPAGTCGLINAPPVLNPGACPVGYPTNPGGIAKDSDGDGLLDCWEDGNVWADGLPGIDFDGDGAASGMAMPLPTAFRDLILCLDTANPATCATKNHKDLFVEVDSMALHPFDPGARAQVIAAFANAPVGNPDLTQGIRLHIQVDDQNVPHILNTALTPCTPPKSANTNSEDFDTLKSQFFGTLAERSPTNPKRDTILAAKKMVFRYALFVHNMVRLPAGSSSPSGCAEVPGNDLVVALGSFGPADANGHKKGTPDQQAGTFMHELGHTLNLRHGGGDNLNCKPNYLSVMSYPRQMAGVPIAGRRLDYSRDKLPTLDEAKLIEASGIGTPAPHYLPGDKTTFGGTATTTAKVLPTDLATSSNLAPLDWDRDGVVDASPLSINLNRVTGVTGLTGCDGAGTVLEGYDDWANLLYNFRASIDWADGVHSTADEVQEITEEQATALFLAADLEGNGICGSTSCQIDIKPFDSSNTVNLAFEKVVGVALLGNPDFDVRTVDPASLTLNNVPVTKVLGRAACALLDINRDRFTDRLCLFPVTGLPLGVSVAVVEGHLRGTDGSLGTIVVAQDRVRVVRNRARRDHDE